MVTNVPHECKTLVVREIWCGLRRNIPYHVLNNPVNLELF